MRILLITAMLAIACSAPPPPAVCAQTSTSSANYPIPVSVASNPQSLEWIADINKGWRFHEGDNPAYAQPAFDDTSWPFVALDDLGPAQTGWCWFRIHIRLPAGHPQQALLIGGGEGTYALYVNGVAMPGPQIFSSVGVSVPIERTVQLNLSGDNLVIALRTQVPPSYAAQRFPILRFASLGTPTAIEQAREALESVRMYAAFPTIAINLLIMLAGIGAIVLYRSQPLHPEYRWLGLYMLLFGLSSALWGCQLNGLLPLSANYLVGDPMVYLFTIAQIEFTYSFGGRRVGRAWRVYEALLLTPILLIWFTWRGQLPFSTYIVIEALIVVPVALSLPIFLFAWYRRGNREAGWLILPTLTLTALVTINDLGDASILLGWQRLDFFHHWILIGAARVQPNDIAELLFLLAIAVVMFFRFTRVSREQARAAAEFDAAQRVQSLLLRTAQAEGARFRIDAVYRPATEVGGDFFHTAEIDGCTRVVVGDVSGKGLGAAMLVSALTGALDSIRNTDPVTLLEQLNELFLVRQQGGFATCLCACITPDARATISNAGHLSPYLNGKEIGIESGLPLGIISRVDYGAISLQLHVGDTLAFVSDGVVEAQDEHGELFGFDRMQQISQLSADQIAQTAKDFGQQDDITVLTLRFAPSHVVQM